MEYKELQNQARELGLPYNKVSREELERSIQEAQVKDNSGEPTEESKEESVPQEEKSSKKSKEESVKSEANTAIVLDGNREVRRYEASVHGKDFEKLANEFAGKRGLTVRAENLEAGVVCPHCGKKINPKKLGF